MVTEGIYVTLGKDQLKDKPYKAQIRDFLIADGRNAVYYWKLSTRPKKDFTTVYIVIGNKVRWKATVIGFEEGRVISFIHGGSMYAKLWMQLIDFVKLPRPYEVKRGFQGFRYRE